MDKKMKRKRKFREYLSDHIFNTVSIRKELIKVRMNRVFGSGRVSREMIKEW